VKKSTWALVVAGCVIAAIAVGILVTGCAQPVEEEEGYTFIWWSEDAGQVMDADVEWCVPGWCDDINEPGDFGYRVAERWHEKFPEYDHIKIKPIVATYGGGRIGQELSAMIRAGEGPNVFNLYAGRAWLAYEIGIKHGDYASDYVREDYLDPSFLDPIMASSGNFSYPVANATLIERACAQEGFECSVPERWSVLQHDEFAEILEAIKALDDGSYGVTDWGTNPSGQNLTWGWMANAGLSPYDDGFTGFAAGGESVLAEMLRWHDEGYMYPGAPGMQDEDALNVWGAGKVAFLHCRLGYLGAFRDPLVDAGEAEAWDEVPLIAIEVVDGVVPLVNGGSLVNAGFVAANTPEEYREAAVSFLHFVLQSNYYQGGVDLLPAMHSQVERGYADETQRVEIMGYIDEHGLAEDGLTEEAYNLLREEWGIQKTSMYLGESTPAEALAAFQAKIVELTEE